MKNLNKKKTELQKLNFVNNKVNSFNIKNLLRKFEKKFWKM